jgi:tetratricopeptide (TPR) repeat protein
MALAVRELPDVPREYLAQWKAAQPSTEENIAGFLGLGAEVGGNALRNASFLGLTGEVGGRIAKGPVSFVLPGVIVAEAGIRLWAGFVNYCAKQKRDRAGSEYLLREVELKTKVRAYVDLLRKSEDQMLALHFGELDSTFQEIAGKLGQFIQETSEKILELGAFITKKMEERQKYVDVKKGYGEGHLLKVAGGVVATFCGGAVLVIGAPFLAPLVVVNIFVPSVMFGSAGVGVVAGWHIESKLDQGIIDNLQTEINYAKVDQYAYKHQLQVLYYNLAVQHFKWAQVKMSQGKYADALSQFERAEANLQRLDIMETTALSEINQHRAICKFLLAEVITGEVRQVERISYRTEGQVCAAHVFPAAGTDTGQAYHFLHAFDSFSKGNYEPAQRSLEHYLAEKTLMEASGNIVGAAKCLQQRLEIAALILQAKIVKKLHRSEVLSEGKQAKMIDAVKILDSVLEILKGGGDIFKEQRELVSRRLLRYAEKIGQGAYIKKYAFYILEHVNKRDRDVLGKLQALEPGVCADKKLLRTQASAFSAYLVMESHFDTSKGFGELRPGMDGPLTAGAAEHCHNAEAWLALTYLGNDSLSAANQIFIKKVVDNNSKGSFGLYLAGLVHEYGLCGYPQNYKTALAHYRVAAKAGVPFAEYRLARIYLGKVAAGAADPIPDDLQSAELGKHYLTLALGHGVRASKTLGVEIGHFSDDHVVGAPTVSIAVLDGGQRNPPVPVAEAGVFRGVRGHRVGGVASAEAR